MNIRTYNSGSISKENILNHGFRIDKTKDYPAIGESKYILIDYSKGNNLFLTGGYWNWYLKDKNGKLLFRGWWNTVEEFENTLKELNNY